MASKIKEFQNKKPDYRDWMPIDGRRYWYIDSQGRICFVCWRSDKEDRYRFLHNNCFKSEADAKYFLKNINVKYKLNRLAFLLNKSRRINWTCKRQKKYLINLKSNGTLEQLEAQTVTIGQIYCLSDKFLNLAINKIGQDKIIEMILSGV